MKLQNINYKNMILIYICRYIMLSLFTSYRKSEICFKYLRMLSRMKVAYILYFKYSFQEIRIINMYVIIHGSVIIHMWSFNSFENCSFQCFYLHQHMFYIPFDTSMGFPIYNIAFYRKCRRNYFHFNISLIELL